ncbi:MAG TPA: putative Ig domain-containing protein, partial [Chryseolinea sp.]
PNQNAMADLAFSYAFPSNTFSDPNAGTTLTYSATLEGGGSLPGWLTFTGSTRTFSGTPSAANLGSINIQVTASDGAPGGTVSDVFTLSVTEAVKVTPTINWSNPAPIVVGTALSSAQLNATATYNGSPVAGSFAYTPPAGTVLSLGTGQQLSVNFTPTNTALYNTASATVTIDVIESLPATFYRAVNMNGPALVIDGNNWISSTGAPNFSFTTNRGTFSSQGIALIPPTDANRAAMIRSSVWGGTINLNMTGVPSGNYQVWLYVWEDNNPEIYSISLEGSVVLSNFNSGTTGMWSKLGPYQATITDGAINVTSSGGHANISGIEVWTASSSSPAARTAATARTATMEEQVIPDSATLVAYPNPFSKKLNVQFTARQSGNARVEIFDARGRSMHLLFNGQMSAGQRKEMEFESSELPDGIYILQFNSGDHVTRLKLIGLQ